MSIPLWVGGLLCLGAVGYLIIIYNGLVRLKHNVEKSWHNIDVLLKQRHDEIPRLVEVCKGYLKHEKETLQLVVEARSNATAVHAPGAEAHARVEAQLGQALGKLFAVAEAYPDLKANENFLKLQQRITDLEDQIADRRELYNSAVTRNNTRIEQFPDVVVAGPLGFSSRQLWSAKASERIAPAISV